MLIMFIIFDFGHPLHGKAGATDFLTIPLDLYPRGSVRIGYELLFLALVLITVHKNLSDLRLRLVNAMY